MKSLRTPLTWVVLLTPLALILGYVGYQSVPGSNMSRSDAVFSAIQLFFFEASVPEEGTPVALNIARFLAPSVVALATIVALVALLRDQVQKAIVSRFAEDHVVLVGLGSKSSLLAQALRSRGHTTVAVESNPANERIGSLREHHVRVVIGDATQPSVLRQLRVARARHVIVASGDDSRNLEIAEQILDVVRDDRAARHTTVHVAISDLGLWSELGALAVQQPSGPTSFEFYNPVDRAAQELLNTVEGDFGLAVYDRVVIDGVGRLAERVLSHYLRRAVLAGVRPVVHLSQRTLTQVLEPLLHDDPDARHAAEFVAFDAALEADSVPLCLVCADASDAEAIGRALALAKSAFREGVYVGVERQQSTNLMDRFGISSKVKLVPAGIEAMTDSFLQLASRELMARARHEDYLAQERAVGVTADQNPSLVPWDQLPESLKESNRRFAEAVGSVIGELGAVLAPLQTVAHRSLDLLDINTLERMAKQEHDRWSQSLLDGGWIYGPGPKDPHAKTHPLLVDWDALPESEREKDRDAIRAIPDMLARIGYRLRFHTASPADTPEPDGSRS